MKPLKALTGFLLYTNLFIGLCAAALVFTNQLTVNGNCTLNGSTWFVFFSTVLTYSALKFNRNNAPAATVHQNWAVANRWWFNGVLAVALVGTVVSFFYMSVQARWVAVGLGVVTAFYGFIPLPGAGGKKKLRDIALLKTFFVAMVWSVTTVIIPFAYHTPGYSIMAFLLVRRFLFILALVMVFEIKDMDDDAREGLHTLPMALGVGRLKILAQAILLVMVGINFLQLFWQQVPWYNTLAVNLSLGVSILCVQPVKRHTPAGWYYVVLDGMMLLQFIFVYLAHLIWQ